MTPNKPGRKPNLWGKSITMRVPVPCYDTVKRIVEAYKNGFKPNPPPI